MINVKCSLNHEMTNNQKISPLFGKYIHVFPFQMKWNDGPGIQP